MNRLGNVSSSPRFPDQELDQRERSANVFMSHPIRQRRQQIQPPRRCRRESHSEPESNELISESRLDKTETRIPALYGETLTEQDRVLITPFVRGFGVDLT